MCILQVLIYGTETLTITRKNEEKHRVALLAMWRRMIGFKLKRTKYTETIAETKIIVLIERTRGLKWSWIGHVARKPPNEWI